MPRKPALSPQQLFEAYYYYYDAPIDKRLSQEQIIKKLQLTIDQANLSRNLKKLKDTFAINEVLYNQYKEYISQITEARYLLKVIEDPTTGGVSFQSPYPWIIDYCVRGYNRAKNKIKYLYNLQNRMKTAERVWEMLNRTNPMSWTEKEVNVILGKVPEGSRYSYVVAMRMISPPIKAIPGLTMGLKTDPRQIAILQSPEFPQIFQKIIKSAIDIAESEREKDEINFILNVKSMTGIRTGKRKFEQGLWGSRIAEGRSYLQVLERDFIWHVLEKKDEEWDINFKPPKLVDIVVNYVRKWDLKKGDWVLSMTPQRAGAILKKACEQNNIIPLELHDLRKVYVSFLVRAGIPLERAIRLNVGWKDIGTANRHYLMFSAIWEDVGEKLNKFSSFFGGA